MAIKMSQSLKQTQSLMITPQLQQAIKLLTLTHLEMTNVIAQEMVENPMLEEFDNELSREEASDNEFDGAELQAESHEATSDNFSGPELVEGSKEQFDWENYIESSEGKSTAPSMVSYDDEDNPNYENMVSRGQTLAEHLEWQLRMENLSPAAAELAYEVIHNLNEDGLLEIPFEEISKKSSLDKEDALDVLIMIQNLDPIGCATQSLQECLLVQARNLIPRVPLVEILIKDHFLLLQSKDYSALSKATGVSVDSVKNAELIIQEFHPRPGKLISSEETQYVVPDIYVKEVGGEFSIQLNDEGVPRLKISNLYKSLIKQKGEVEEHNKGAQEFVQEKLRAALWLIKSIENRQKTIHKVADAILKYQPEFFKKGPKFLRPMILKDIALEIGMHESTVSRVTTNKFMHTPIGTFELKYFFNAGIGGKNGGIDIAGESLKLKIKALVDSEDVRRPISDQKIAELLSEDDIVVARRTVAKYRELMGILPSSKRKKS